MNVIVLNKKNLITIILVFVLFIASMTVSLNYFSSIFRERIKEDSNTSQTQKTEIEKSGNTKTTNKENNDMSTDAQTSTGKKIPIYSVETEKKEVALTFNSAWGNEDIPKLLNLFEKHKIKVTFFFVGNWVERFPESVSQIFKAGHLIGNHSDQHPDMTKLDSSKIINDIKKCNQRIAEITGTTPLYFRAPSGAYDNKTIAAAESLDMISVQWDVDSIDWKDPSAQEIVERVCSKTQNGSIVLFHSGKENTYEALPQIIENLQSQGFSFVSLDELIIKDNFFIDHAGRQHKK